MKYNIIRWNEVLYRGQPYIQLEEAMKSSAKPSLNCGNNRTKSKPRYGDPFVDNQGRGQDAFKKQPFPPSQQNPL